MAGVVCGEGELRFAPLRSLAPLSCAGDRVGAFAFEDDTGLALDFWTSVVFGLSWAALAPDSNAKATAKGTESGESLFMLMLLERG